MSDIEKWAAGRGSVKQHVAERLASFRFLPFNHNTNAHATNKDVAGADRTPAKCTGETSLQSNIGCLGSKCFLPNNPLTNHPLVHLRKARPQESIKKREGEVDRLKAPGLGPRASCLLSRTRAPSRGVRLFLRREIESNERWLASNPRSEHLDLRGFCSGRFLMLRGKIPGPMRNSPEI